MIALAVHWYLSYADVAELLAERGVNADPSTVYDGVQAFTSRFINAAQVHRSPIGSRWRVDEIYLTIGSRWRHLYWAIDEQGQIINVYLSDRRNAAAAHTCFTQAIDTSAVTPTRVTTDKAKRYPRPYTPYCLTWSIDPRSISTMGSNGTTNI